MQGKSNHLFICLALDSRNASKNSHIFSAENSEVGASSESAFVNVRFRDVTKLRHFAEQHTMRSFNANFSHTPIHYESCSL